MRPDFLAIGHVAKDMTPDGFLLGGAVVYGAIAARRLGLSSAVVTSAGSDVDIVESLADIPLHIVPSAQTTSFVNSYAGGRRTQFIRAVGDPISATDIPPEWMSAPLVMLGPLAQELDAELAGSFPESKVLASIQGWLRQWDDEGRVSPCDWAGTDVLPHVDAAILSVDDIEDRAMLDRWKYLAPVLIVTRGPDGADVHYDGDWHHVDSFPVTEVDPTGAGDVFAAAFLVRFGETSDVLTSAKFASCAAGFCVSRQGTEGIPYRAEVEARLADAGT